MFVVSAFFEVHSFVAHTKGCLDSQCIETHLQHHKHSYKERVKQR